MPLGTMVSMSPQIAIDRSAIADFCQRHHVRRLAFFGSVLRKDFGPQSDVDVLVEFEPGHVPGFAFFDLQEELSGILGRSVDLHTPGSLSRYFRESVVREAQDQYVAA
jgi:predicted nucleotidyltransferase